MAAGATLNADLHILPTVHVDNVSGAAIVSYVNTNAAPTASLTAAVTNNSLPAPDVASFSSRGLSLAGGGDKRRGAGLSAQDNSGDQLRHGKNAQGTGL